MGLIETIQDVVALVKKTDNLELTRKMLDLQSEAMTLLDQLARQQQEPAQPNTTSLAETLARRGPAYYDADNSGKLTDGPYCTRCYDVDHLKSRIVDLGGPDYECQVCRTHFLRNEITFNLEPAS